MSHLEISFERVPPHNGYPKRDPHLGNCQTPKPESHWGSEGAGLRASTEKEKGEREREGRKEGRKEGMKEGTKEGRNEGRKEGRERGIVGFLKFSVRSATSRANCCVHDGAIAHQAGLNPKP